MRQTALPGMGVAEEVFHAREFSAVAAEEVAYLFGTSVDDVWEWVKGGCPTETILGRRRFDLKAVLAWREKVNGRPTGEKAARAVKRAALVKALEEYKCPKCGKNRPKVTSTLGRMRKVKCVHCGKPGKVSA